MCSRTPLILVHNGRPVIVVEGFTCGRFPLLCYCRHYVFTYLITTPTLLEFNTYLDYEMLR